MAFYFLNVSLSKGTAAKDEDFDDADGYLKLAVGEVMDQRYRILGFHGKGVFSTVLRCLDLETQSEVAIKVARNNDAM